MLKTWSSTPATVALSSAEAELYAPIKSAAQALGLMTSWPTRASKSRPQSTRMRARRLASSAAPDSASCAT